jgi:3-deoxy-D-manno-octulosonate 8-phosphate phosphatase (KDO 8-P phosphatase)
VSAAASPNTLSRIRLVAFDIDGVFTDGRFYLSDAGIESKSFNTQDGYGIRRLIDSDITVAVISGRESAAVTARMQELGVTHVVQGCRDKVAALGEITAELGISMTECAYVGDDIPDLPMLQAAGYAVAVANAVKEVQQACDYTTAAAGGHGAVREVCELVLAAHSGAR